MSKKYIFYVLVVFVFITGSSFQTISTLKGKWKFVGGIYNGKKEGAPTEYTLQKKYTDKSYEAFMLEKGSKALKYEAGNYNLKIDTLTDTETFSLQPSKITGIPINYHFTLSSDTLTISATLPTGMQVEEYWLKIK
jgi:hypothetical protein